MKMHAFAGTVGLVLLITNPLPEAFSHPDLAPVVAEVLPGVVNIRSSDLPNIVEENREEESGFFSLLLGPARSPTKSQASTSRGSGFFYPDRQTIVTNWHVVRDASVIVIFATEMNIYRKAEILGHDPAIDLALLRVSPVDGARPLKFGSSEDLRLGQSVFAIGNPLGYGNTVTSGILSAKGRTIGPGALSYLLQTDVAMNPGNSGGPLFDVSGRVVGINTANVEKAQGISFAIPAEIAEKRIQQILREGRTNQPWLGLWVEDIVDNPKFALSSFGVIVKAVQPGSPGARMGIAAGDVLQTFNQRRLASVNQLDAELKRQSVGETVEIGLYRSGKSSVVNVRLEPAPRNRNGTY